MNIYNFDGDDLNFDIYNGKENYASGFLKLSEITGDKYHTRNLTLESNPSALASMVQEWATISFSGCLEGLERS